MKKNLLKIVLFSLLLLPCSFVWADTDPSENLLDNAQIFNSSNREIIEKELSNFNQNKKVKLSIITINSLEQKFNIYCYNLHKEKLGQKNSLDQITLIYIKLQNKILGCRSAKGSQNVTDAELSYIISELVQPNIDSRNYEFSFRIAISKINHATNKNILPADIKKNNSLQISKQSSQILAWLFVLILFSWLTTILGRTKAWWLGGVLGLFLGLAIWSISRIIIFIPFLSISGLIYDYFISKHYKEFNNAKKSWFWIHQDKKNKK